MEDLCVIAIIIAGYCIEQKLEVRLNPAFVSGYSLHRTGLKKRFRLYYKLAQKVIELE